ncbi:hypothetical protein ES703_110596 [subsurface metagenome]
MVTISVKKADLLTIGEALMEYGISTKLTMLGETCIRILRRLKNYEKARSTKDIYNMWIIRIQKYQGMPTSTYKKSKMAS